MACCCTDGEAAAPNRWTPPIAGLIEWAIPVVVLALIPKCPACVAGYVLLATGVGLSLPVASAVRWGLIALSIVALVYLAVRAARRALRQNSLVSASTSRIISFQSGSFPLSNGGAAPSGHGFTTLARPDSDDRRRGGRTGLDRRRVNARP